MENNNEEHQDDYFPRRYFIIHFSGLRKDKTSQRGQLQMYTDGGKFVSEMFVHDTIQEKYNLTDPFITNIHELDEDDFFDFVEGKTAIEIKNMDEEDEEPDQPEFL